MQTYNEKLTGDERAAVEEALDHLDFMMGVLGVKLSKTDLAAVAAEALAVYIMASKDRS